MKTRLGFVALVSVLWTTDASLAFAPPPPRSPETCALIPLDGAVGLSSDPGGSFSAEDFRRCLDAVTKSGARTIVLHVKSPGGRVDTKESIMRELLAAKAKGVRTIAVIEDAGSAAALISLACSEWYVLPGARLGAAATVLSGPLGTVSFDEALKADPTLAAKYKSFESAADEEACRATGRSTDLALAMKNMDATLFFTPGKGFSRQRLGESSIELDNKESILTLTATQLTQFGLAKPAASLDEAMQEIGTFDPALTKKLKSEMTQSCKRLESLLKSADRLIEQYEDLPSGGSGRGFGFGGGNSRDAGKQAASAREAARQSKRDQINKKIRDILELLENP